MAAGGQNLAELSVRPCRFNPGGARVPLCPWPHLEELPSLSRQG